MNKAVRIVVAFALFAIQAHAQQPGLLWADGFGGRGTDLAVKFVRDDVGNYYVTGHYTDSCDFNPGPAQVWSISNGDSDIFVAKFGKNGELMWNFSIGGVGPDEGLGIVLKNDLLFITGSFSGSNVEFDPILGGAQLTSHGNKDIFIANYDTTGFLLWAYGIGGGNNDVSSGIAVDDSSNIVITGSFSGSVDFDPDTGITNLVSGGSPTDAFIAKYTIYGRLVWAKDFGLGTYADAGVDVAVDDSGNVFTTGQFQATNVDFDPPAGGAYLTSAGSYDAYIASYTPGGAYRWAFNIGGSFADRCNSVAVDQDQNVLITGKFSGSNIDFDPGPNTAPLTSNNFDVFVAKYDNDGNYLWAHKFGSAGAGDEGMAITSNTYSNDVVVTGAFESNVDFDPGSGTALQISLGGTDIFVASYTPAGNYNWSFRAGGTGNDYGYSLDAYYDVNIARVLVGGSFAGTSDFDPGPGVVNLTAFGSNDLFLAQYHDFSVGISSVPSAGTSFSVYPNPAANTLRLLFNENVLHGTLAVSDMRGRTVRAEAVSGKEKSLDVSALDNGVYFVTLNSQEGISRSRFIVAH